MSKLGDIAKSVTARGALSGKERLAMEELIRKYPEGVTVNGFYKLASQFGEDYFAFTFAEDESKYFSGTTALNEIGLKWLEACESAESVNRELEDSPLKLVMERVKTKQGKPFTKVTVVE